MNNKFKIGDVAYHKAGDELLGTICAINGEKVVVRRAKTLVEVEMYEAELKTQDQIREENRALAERINQGNQDLAKRHEF